MQGTSHIFPVAPALPEDLTQRELEILELIAEGWSNVAIAMHLVLSRRTVESHVRAIFQKLDVVDDGMLDRRLTAARAYWSAHGVTAAPLRRVA